MLNPPCFAKQNATATAGAEDFTPCFAKQNATAIAGAEDFTPCFFVTHKVVSYLVAYDVYAPTSNQLPSLPIHISYILTQN